MASTPSSIDIPGLGRLTAMPDAPPGEAFWEGVFLYREDGRSESSRFYLCVTDGPEPGAAQLALAQRILGSIDQRLDEARALLKRRLQDDPGLFGVDDAEAGRYLAKGDALLPFAAPEPTFYAPPEWQLRFADSPLPACAQLGVAVAFQDETPVEIIDLSDSEEIA